MSMDIMEINPIEFGGAVAHIAAGQVFQILSSTENMAGPQSIDWYGSGDQDNNDVATDIMLFADYVAQTAAGGERLWRWGVINGLIMTDVPDGHDYSAVPASRRWAFDMFATISLQGFTQMLTLQNEEKGRLALEAMANTNQPLALEDSIFEPEGSLGELEKHAPEFFAQVAEGDALRLAAEEASLLVEQENAAAQGIATMSIGAMAPGGEANEEVPAETGSEAGGAAAADPDGSEQVHAMGSDLGEQHQSSTGGTVPIDSETVAQQGDDDAGEEGGDRGVPGEAEPEREITPQKASGSKTKKRN
jgi:hypothetical protein